MRSLGKRSSWETTWVLATTKVLIRCPTRLALRTIYRWPVAMVRAAAAAAAEKEPDRVAMAMLQAAVGILRLRSARTPR
jgi:hypothetical protein